MDSSFNKDLLHKKWVYHPEENTDSEMVYRPANPSVPSRNRKALDLRDDGTFVQTDIGAADTADESSGSWKLVDNTLEFFHGDSPAPTGQWQINSINPEKLTIQK